MDRSLRRTGPAAGCRVRLGVRLLPIDGAGTHQGAEGETSSHSQAPVDSKSGKNEDSGSATGAVRSRSATGSESGASHGSARPDEGGRNMKESGAGTQSGAAKSRT